MVMGSSLFDPMSPGCRTARLRSALGIQRTALAGTNRLAMAHDGARFPALACGASANPALAAGGLLRIDGARPAGTAARVRGTRGTAQRDGAGQSHAAIDTGVRRT